jgi:phage/plasmid-associated DNA primase
LTYTSFPDRTWANASCASACQIYTYVTGQATELYLAYRKWAEIGGEYVLPQTTFGRRLEERGITSEKRGRDRARVKWPLGVRLIDPLLAGDPREAYRGNGVIPSRNNGDRDRHISGKADALF